MRFDGCQGNLRYLCRALYTLAGVLLISNSAASQTKSDAKVKVSATATKIEATGKQTVTVTLDIDKGWHIYANPVGDDLFEPVQTVVKVTAGVKLVRVDVRYPTGKVHDDIGIKWMSYEEKVDITIVVERAEGDTSALEVEASFNATSADRNLLPARVTRILK